MKNGLQILQSLSYLEKSFIYPLYWIYLMVKSLPIQSAQDLPIHLYQKC